MSKKCVGVILLVLSVLIMIPSGALAQDKATPDEVYELILKAYGVVKELGADGLEAFKDPKGEFTYKDTYVLVLDCAKNVMVAHPNNKLIGLDFSGMLDKNPDPAKIKNHSLEMCEVSKNPNGGWTEYYWEKLGEDTPSRKVSFAIRVPETDYMLVAGIYSDDVDVEELNAKLR